MSIIQTCSYTDNIKDTADNVVSSMCINYKYNFKNRNFYTFNNRVSDLCSQYRKMISKSETTSGDDRRETTRMTY